MLLWRSVEMDYLLEDEDEIDLAYNKGFEEGFKAALEALKETEEDSNKTHS